ncbi:MAG: tudor domain-containing protein [Anaerolineae bacterium]
MPTVWHDLASADARDLWLHHPEIGDISFDSFERLSANPIFTGKAPYEWPVNGFLLRDPVSHNLYVYIGAYPKGYWGKEAPSYCHLLRSRDDGATWDDLGPILQGTTDLFDACDGMPGHTPDVSVVYADGRYHMIYDWARHTGDLAKKDGGFAYAWSDSPEGPFHRAPEPAFAQSNQPAVFGMYRMAYAAALVKRRDDWLVISDMSTLNNQGGSWALVAFTAKHPAGPYSGPHFLLWPQTTLFYPTTVESFPVFAHDGYLYAPNTTVARNRNYQILYRAPLEQAHTAGAWEVYQHGSVWHAEASDNEAQGIWGQTFSAEVEADGTMWAMFACKNSQDMGTINIAKRPWSQPYRHGGVLSAPNGPAISIIQRDYLTFELQAALRATGPKRLIWQHNAPLGPDRPMGADGGPHPLTLADCCEVYLDDSGWRLRRIDAAGDITVVAQGVDLESRGHGADQLELRQEANRLTIHLNGSLLWQGAWTAKPGCIGLIADLGSRVWLDELLLSEEGAPCTRFLLPTDGVMGYGLLGNSWQCSDDPAFRYGFGYETTMEGAGCKWCYYGAGFTLWSPRAPQYGRIEVWLDGRMLTTLDLCSETTVSSTPIYTLSDLERGYHAVTLLRLSGTMPCDVLQVTF